MLSRRGDLCSCTAFQRPAGIICRSRGFPGWLIRLRQLTAGVPEQSAARFAALPSSHLLGQYDPSAESSALLHCLPAHCWQALLLLGVLSAG